MDHQRPTIRIVAARSPTGCGGCAGDASAPVCRADLGEACAAPALFGPVDLLRRALDSLRSVVDPERGLNLVDGHLIAALRVDADEVELTVTFPPTCGIAQVLADDAFQSLRRALPDTDIYVRHAA